MSPVALIIWIWFFIAVGIYVYRLIRWMGERGDPTAERKPTRRELREAQLAQMQSASEGPSPTEQLFREALAERQGASGTDAEHATDETAAGSGGAAEPDAPAPVATVAELLAGMQWPCDLAPIIDTTATDLYRRVAFSTTGFTSTEVASAVRTGLVALGYDVVPVDDVTFVATGERGRLAAIVHGDPGVVAAADRPAWTTLPSGSVVVELTARS